MAAADLAACSLVRALGGSQVLGRRRGRLCEYGHLHASLWVSDVVGMGSGGKTARSRGGVALVPGVGSGSTG